MLVCFNFIVVPVFCFLPCCPEARRPSGATQPHRKWDAFRAAASWSIQVETRILQFLFSGNLQAAGAYSSSANLTAEELPRNEFQI
jgi:hypothetical protein